jgi:hypothetical protein
MWIDCGSRRKFRQCHGVSLDRSGTMNIPGSNVQSTKRNDETTLEIKDSPGG